MYSSNHVIILNIIIEKKINQSKAIGRNLGGFMKKELDIASYFAVVIAFATLFMNNFLY